MYAHGRAALTPERPDILDERRCARRTKGAARTRRSPAERLRGASTESLVAQAAIVALAVRAGDRPPSLPYIVRNGKTPQLRPAMVVGPHRHVQIVGDDAGRPCPRSRGTGHSSSCIRAARRRRAGRYRYQCRPRPLGRPRSWDMLLSIGRRAPARGRISQLSALRGQTGATAPASRCARTACRMNIRRRLPALARSRSDSAGLVE